MSNLNIQDFTVMGLSDESLESQITSPPIIHGKLLLIFNEQFVIHNTRKNNSEILSSAEMSCTQSPWSFKQALMSKITWSRSVPQKRNTGIIKV